MLLPYPNPHMNEVQAWPLRNISIANIVFCIAYTRRVRETAVLCAVVVQYYRNSGGLTGGGSNTMMIGSFPKSVEVNLCLVKAKSRYRRPHADRPDGYGTFQEGGSRTRNTAANRWCVLCRLYAAAGRVILFVVRGGVVFRGGNYVYIYIYIYVYIYIYIYIYTYIYIRIYLYIYI